MPEMICMWQGYPDLNGVVQLTGHGVDPLASHTAAAQGPRKRVGMGKHLSFKSLKLHQLQIVMVVLADNQ